MRAARLFAEKYEWSGEWVGGGSADGTGEYFVRLVSRSASARIADGRGFIIRNADGSLP